MHEKLFPPLNGVSMSPGPCIACRLSEVVDLAWPSCIISLLNHVGCVSRCLTSSTFIYTLSAILLFWKESWYLQFTVPHVLLMVVYPNSGNQLLQTYCIYLSTVNLLFWPVIALIVSLDVSENYLSAVSRNTIYSKGKGKHANWRSSSSNHYTGMEHLRGSWMNNFDLCQKSTNKVPLSNDI